MIGIYDQALDTSQSAGLATVNLQFVPVSVQVDNPTSSWLYWPDIHKWVAPFTIGVCFPWTSVNQTIEVDYTLLPSGVAQATPILTGIAQIRYNNQPLIPSAGTTTQGSVVTVPKTQIGTLDQSMTTGQYYGIASPRGPQKSIYLIGFFYDIGNEGTTWTLQDSNNTPYITFIANNPRSHYVPFSRLQIPNGVSMQVKNNSTITGTIHCALFFDYNNVS